ncbi:MAG: squalene/phytoene synthase family protein [Elusimicrobiales bacterium]|jgi:phytoene synthase
MPLNPTCSYEAGSSFKPAFLFLEPEQRRALSAFYGYARTVDDIADAGAAAPPEKEAALAAWKERIEALFSGGAPRGRLEEELAWAAKTFSMRKENFLLLLEGVGLDARKKEYASFEELKFYMYRVASAVGLSALEIFGWRGAGAEAYAENLGYAVQLTNIIRDVFEDARLGRTYIPLEDLRKFGCDRSSFPPRTSLEQGPAKLSQSEADPSLRNFNYPANFIELMKFEAARARVFYAAARTLAGRADKPGLLSAFVMDRLYSDLLDKLEARRFRTAGPRIRLNLFEKVRAVYRARKAYKRSLAPFARRT